MSWPYHRSDKFGRLPCANGEAELFNSVGIQLQQLMTVLSLPPDGQGAAFALGLCRNMIRGN